MQDTAAEVQLVYAGKAPVESRSVIEHELDPAEQSPFLEDQIEEHARVFSGWTDTDAIGWFYGQLGDADQPQAAAAMSALAGALLQRITVRDAMWLVVDSPEPDAREYWRALTRHLPGRYRAPAAFLYAWACFRAGDGARAAEAVKAALAADPDYSAARLLQTALTQGVDPRRIPALTKEDLS